MKRLNILIDAILARLVLDYAYKAYVQVAKNRYKERLFRERSPEFIIFYFAIYCELKGLNYQSNWDLFKLWWKL